MHERATLWVCLRNDPSSWVLNHLWEALAWWCREDGNNIGVMVYDLMFVQDKSGKSRWFIFCYREAVNLNLSKWDLFKGNEKTIRRKVHWKTGPKKCGCVCLSWKLSHAMVLDRGLLWYVRLTTFFRVRSGYPNIRGLELDEEKMVWDIFEVRVKPTQCLLSWKIRPDFNCL